FLGTRYQDLVVENINYLFSKLGVDIQINEENVMNDNWLGIETSVSPQTVHDFDNPELFNGVTNIYWKYGNSFTVSSNADSIATIDSKTVIALYNGTSQGKGHLLAFGDLNWLYYDYKSTSYAQDHSNVLKNIMEFFLQEEDISINIDLERERISNSEIDMYIYMKNQTSGSPITTYTSLNVSIKNTSFSDLITLNTTHSDNGIYFNDSYNLPYPSYSPYIIKVNLTIGLKEYIKITKILYFDPAEVPEIVDLYSNDAFITRAPFDSTNLIVEMDDSTYGDIEGYSSIYSYSFTNTKESINKTLTFSHIGSNLYRNMFDPDDGDPSGFAIYYVIPINSNYTNPNSPRSIFEIINNPPEIIKTSSTFSLTGYADISFDETESDEGSFVYSASQGDTFNFAVDVRDKVNYEDDNFNMRVFVNLFICSVTEDNYLIFIFPQTIEVAELAYQSSSLKYEGSYTIPDTMRYNSITGTKLVSTAADFDIDTNEGYLGILYFKVYDSEGGIDDFIVILMISGRPFDFSLIIIIVISIIALLGVLSMIVYYARRKRYPRVQPRYQEYYYRPSYEEPEEESYITPEPVSQLGPAFYCPFCGEFIKTPKKFCPHCGESLSFFQQDE
ncbi:MAG: zinc ribbon domain-containing protein, partial [Promethearchaeota archaeon]